MCGLLRKVGRMSQRKRSETEISIVSAKCGGKCYIVLWRGEIWKDKVEDRSWTRCIRKLRFCTCVHWNVLYGKIERDSTCIQQESRKSRWFQEKNSLQNAILSCEEKFARIRSKIDREPDASGSWDFVQVRTDTYCIGKLKEILPAFSRREGNLDRFKKKTHYKMRTFVCWTNKIEPRLKPEWRECGFC